MRILHFHCFDINFIKSTGSGQVRLFPSTYLSVSNRHSEDIKPSARYRSPASPISFLLRSSSCSLQDCLRAVARYLQACEVIPQPCNLSIFSLQFWSLSPSTSILTPLSLMLLYPRSSSLRYDSFVLRIAAKAGQHLSVRLENRSLQEIRMSNNGHHKWYGGQLFWSTCPMKTNNEL